MPADILALFSARGLDPKKVTATEWASGCPACGGKDRCKIWPADHDGRGGYWCRQCQTYGDAIQFLRDYEGMGYAEACRHLGIEAAKASAALPRPRRVSGPEPFEAAPTDSPKDAWASKASAFLAWCHQHLLNNREQLGWLAERGLPLEAVKRFRLGWNPGENGKGCLIRHRAAWGIPDQEIPAKGDKPASVKRTFWLPRGLVIPQLGQDGQVLRLRIRRPDADREKFLPETKYFVVPGSAMDAMILGESRAMAVVESELDALMLAHQVGDLVGVVSIMTSTVKRIEAGVLEALARADCILVALDFDGAGAKGWPRWQASFSRAKRWPCPVGKDPGEAYAQGANLRAWIVAGLPPVMQPGVLEPGKSRVEGEGGENQGAAQPEPAPQPAEPAALEVAEQSPVQDASHAGDELPRIFGVDWRDGELVELWRTWPAEYLGREKYFELLGLRAACPVRIVRTRREGERPEADGLRLVRDQEWERAFPEQSRRAYALWMDPDVSRVIYDLDWPELPVRMIGY